MNRGWMFCVGVAALWAGACNNSGGSTVNPPPPVTLFSNSNLQGQYAFSMTGSTVDPVNGVVPFTRVGSFMADGKGGITGGTEDVHVFLDAANEFEFTGGSYSINGDGRGTMSLIDSTGTITFSVTMTTSNNGYLIDMPTDLSSASSGNFVKQNTSSFLLSGVSGSYAFDISGLDAQGTPESVVGQLVSNGTGTLSGFADDNDGAVINGGVAGAANISGTYVADPFHVSDLTAFGRGIFSIGGINGVFYVIGPNQVKLMETSSGGTLVGDALLQTSIPTTAAGLSGGFVYVMGGSGSGVPITRGGKFSASSGALSSIIVDNNNAGSVVSLATSSGTYTVDPSGNGRGTITYNVAGQKNTFTYVFYMISPTQAFVQDQSLNIVEDGTMLAQGTGTISDSSLAGNYAINWSGVTSTGNGTAIGEEDLVGATTLASEALTGTVDINEFSSGKQGSQVGLTGTLKLSGDPTGHNALTINLQSNPANNGITSFAYVAANNNVLIMGTQTVRIVAGVMTPQAP